MRQNVASAPKPRVAPAERAGEYQYGEFCSTSLEASSQAATLLTNNEPANGLDRDRLRAITCANFDPSFGFARFHLAIALFPLPRTADAGLRVKKNNSKQIENCVRLTFRVPTCLVVLSWATIASHK
jgi:hypothetical protein